MCWIPTNRHSPERPSERSSKCTFNPAGRVALMLRVPGKAHRFVRPVSSRASRDGRRNAARRCHDSNEHSLVSSAGCGFENHRTKTADDILQRVKRFCLHTSDSPSMRGSRVNAARKAPIGGRKACPALLSIRSLKFFHLRDIRMATSTTCLPTLLVRRGGATRTINLTRREARATDPRASPAMRATHWQPPRRRADTPPRQPARADREPNYRRATAVRQG